MKNRWVVAAAMLIVMVAPLATAQTTSAPAAQTAPAIPKDWVTVKGWNVITFWAPPDLKDEKVMGIDSQVGRYTSKTMTVSYDYGFYSNSLNDAKYKRTAIKLDGRDAFLVRGDGFVGVYVPQVTGPDNGVKFEMSITCDAASIEQALLIVQSVKFLAPTTATQKAN